MHENVQLNPLILALIGIPTVLGFYLRFFRFNGTALELNAKVSLIVYLTIAIGYCFIKFDNPNVFFEKNNFLVLKIFITIFFLFLIPIFSDAEPPLGCIAIMMLFYVVYNLDGIIPTYAIKYSISISTVILFCLFGLANCLLGSIISGFTISAAIHSYFITGTLDNIFVWKEIFEFVEISNAPIKFMILAGTAFGGASELIYSYFEQ